VREKKFLLFKTEKNLKMDKDYPKKTGHF